MASHSRNLPSPIQDRQLNIVYFSRSDTGYLVFRTLVPDLKIKLLETLTYKLH